MGSRSVSVGLRAMFSMLTPNESSFERVEEVPPYVQQATPFFVGLMVLELVVGLLKTGRSVVTISDGLTSIAAGMVSRLPLLLLRGCELSAYMYVWEHFRLLELPWDSAWTWWFTLIGVDFGYYWVHRFAHEVAVLWAAHQVHHSSEYYNLTTALRQSAAQQFASWVFYLPLALAVPPSIFAVHIQLNLLYQFWIHTELIRDLGPLEWVFNTPKHHRVHHGRNLYCIDKNYGGILIIWDRLFGTFAPEEDKVIYGLVFPIRRYESLFVQLHYYRYLWKKSKAYKTFSDKVSTFLKGPSWKPGKARLGDHVDNPKVSIPTHLFLGVWGKPQHPINPGQLCRWNTTSSFSPRLKLGLKETEGLKTNMSPFGVKHSAGEMLPPLFTLLVTFLKSFFYSGGVGHLCFLATNLSILLKLWFQCLMKARQVY
uniref:Transmembrane protein 195 n=1 Tax=Oryzias sinensis TaxID=183150 RepID=A0A8C7Z652_9TELE